MYPSRHTARFGAYYAYDADASTFEFYNGEELRDDTRRPVDYPKTVQIVDDTHPEIFAANGSHGFWATPGKLLFFLLRHA